MVGRSFQGLDGVILCARHTCPDRPRSQAGALTGSMNARRKCIEGGTRSETHMDMLSQHCIT